MATNGCPSATTVDELATSILGSQCPFRVLGLSADATLAEVKGAYRRLCLLFHPDKSSLAPQLASEVFQALQRAYAAACQQFQSAQQPSSFQQDLWRQFYAAPTVSAAAGKCGAPEAGPAVGPRPAPATRQGGLWGSARGPVACARNRQNGVAAPSATPGPAAVVVEGDLPEELRGETRDASPIVERRGQGGRTVKLQQAGRRTRTSAAEEHISVHAPKEFAGAFATAAEPGPATGREAVPLSKRRRVGADGSSRAGNVQADKAKASAGRLVELLHQRRSVAGHNGSANPAGAYLSKTVPQACGEDDALPQQDLEPDITHQIQGAQAGNAWTRRPVFGMAARQAPYPPVLTERTDDRSHNCLESDGEGPDGQIQQRTASKKGLAGGCDVTWEQGPLESSSEGSSREDGEASSLEAALQGTDAGIPSPTSAGADEPKDISDSEDVWDTQEDPRVGPTHRYSGGRGDQAVQVSLRGWSAPPVGQQWAANRQSAAPSGPDLGSAVGPEKLQEPGQPSLCPGSSTTGVHGHATIGRLRLHRPPVQTANASAREIHDLSLGEGSAIAISERGWLARTVPSPPSSTRVPSAAAAGLSGGAGQFCAAPASRGGISLNPLRPGRLSSTGEPQTSVHPQQAVGHRSDQQGALHGAPKLASALPVSHFYHMGGQATSRASNLVSGDCLGRSSAGKAGDQLHVYAEATERMSVSAEPAQGGVDPHPSGGYATACARVLKQDPDGEDCDDLSSHDVDGSENLDGEGGIDDEVGDAGPDDDWWNEPIPSRGVDVHEQPCARESLLHGPEAAGSRTLDMFLQQVQRGGELQAQRAGQARLSNLRRHTLTRRGRGRASGSGRRGGGGCKRGATKGAGGALGKVGRGHSSTANILRYSRPIKG